MVAIVQECCKIWAARSCPPASRPHPRVRCEYRVAQVPRGKVVWHLAPNMPYLPSCIGVGEQDICLVSHRNPQRSELSRQVLTRRLAIQGATGCYSQDFFYCSQPVCYFSIAATQTEAKWFPQMQLGHGYLRR